MPLVTVSMYPGRTQEQKEEFAKAITKSCSFCDKPIQYRCNKCNYDTDEQTHLDCFKDSFEKELEKLPHVN